MKIVEFERELMKKLPGAFLKDIFPRGMRRLAEYGWFRQSSEVTTKFGFKIVADRLDAVKWYIYYFGQFEPQISLAWKRLLQPGDNVVDIGGNVGYHALLAASLVGPTGQVVTIEPSNFIHHQLSNNIALNGYRHVIPLKNAVSNVAGMMELYYAGDNVQGNSSFYRTANCSQSETVECITVEQIGNYIDLGQVKLFKIDVEGAEPLVLEGLFRSLIKLHPDVVIFVEISPNNTDDAQAMLDPFIRQGFEARLIENEYSTEFYRDTSDVKLHPLLIKPGVIHDVVLCRNPSLFERILGSGVIRATR